MMLLPIFIVYKYAVWLLVILSTYSGIIFKISSVRAWPQICPERDHSMEATEKIYGTDKEPCLLENVGHDFWHVKLTQSK